MNVASLIRDIIQNNPPLIYLDLNAFSDRFDVNENSGDIILDALLNSSISTIKDLNLGYNYSWFKNV